MNSKLANKIIEKVRQSNLLEEDKDLIVNYIEMTKKQFKRKEIQIKNLKQQLEDKLNSKE